MEAGEPFRANSAATLRQIALAELLADRGMTLTALADAIGVTNVNLNILKNQRGELFVIEPDR